MPPTLWANPRRINMRPGPDFAQPLDEHSAVRTGAAMPFDSFARGGLQLSIQVAGDVCQYFAARVRRCAHTCSSCFRNIKRAR